MGGGARFSAPIQTGPGAHPASYTMGTGSFRGVKRPGCGVNYPPPSSAKVEGRVELYICSLSGPSWPVLGRTLPLVYQQLIEGPFSLPDRSSEVSLPEQNIRHAAGDGRSVGEFWSVGLKVLFVML